MVHYRHGPATDERFLSVVETWLHEAEELFVRFTLSHCGGSGGCEFCESMEAVKHFLEKLPPATRVTVFRGLRLPLRGIVDSDFIREAENLIPDGRDFLVARYLPEDSLGLSDYAGSTHEDLREYLSHFWGEHVALGEEPHFVSESAESAITATKDGLIGAY